MTDSFSLSEHVGFPEPSRNPCLIMRSPPSMFDFPGDLPKLAHMMGLPHDVDVIQVCGGYSTAHK